MGYRSFVYPDTIPLQACPDLPPMTIAADATIPTQTEARPGLDSARRHLGRENNFDFLRFILAAGVIFSHCFSMQGHKDREPLYWFSSNQVDIGSLAVNGFFILSGYLIAQSFLQSRSVWNYLMRRVRRIYPGFIAAALLSLLFFGALPMGFGHKYWAMVQPWIFLKRLPALKELWVPNSFTQNFWPYVNSPPWTLQYEFVCYVLIAAVGVVGLLRRGWGMLGLFAICYGYNVIQFPLKLWVHNWQWLAVGGQPDFYPRFFTYFLAGTMALIFRERIRYRTTGCVLAVVALTAALGWGKRWEAKTHYVTWLEVVQPIAASYLLFAFAFSKRVRLHRWARWGDFSYGLYMYGWPVTQVMIMVMGREASPWLLTCAALPATGVFAVASWYGVERWFLRKKKSAGGAEVLAATQKAW